jgi:hypothetical protein
MDYLPNTQAYLATARNKLEKLIKPHGVVGCPLQDESRFCCGGASDGLGDGFVRVSGCG